MQYSMNLKVLLSTCSQRLAANSNDKHVYAVR